MVDFLFPTSVSAFRLNLKLFFIIFKEVQNFRAPLHGAVRTVPYAVYISWFQKFFVLLHRTETLS